MASTKNSPEHVARVEALTEQLREPLLNHLRHIAESLIHAQDRQQLFGDIEFQLRDHALRIASAAHQTLLDSQKKTATTALPASATTARTTLASSTIATEPS